MVANDVALVSVIQAQLHRVGPQHLSTQMWRAPTIRSTPNEVAEEAADKTAEEAAINATEEETEGGVAPADVIVMGCLDAGT